MSDPSPVPKSSDVVWHHAVIQREHREQQNRHRSFVLWFTGLSSAGKSTLAHAVEERLYQMGMHSYVLDGDNVRHGLNGDLGFSLEDRKENIRRIGEVAKLFVDAGVIVMTAFISPLRADREQVRSLLMPGDFLEVYCRCPLDVCRQRDVKGLYQRATQGEIKDYTGVSSPYEEPQAPELTIDTAERSLDESVDLVFGLLESRGLLKAKT